MRVKKNRSVKAGGQIGRLRQGMLEQYNPVLPWM
jgi:hypothetical protein